MEYSFMDTLEYRKKQVHYQWLWKLKNNLMKIIKIQLIVFLCFANTALFAQDVERFIGTFRITGECVDLNHESNIFDEERDIILSAGNESGLLLNISSFSSNYLQVFIHNDSIFIPLQSFENFDGTQASFSGEGKVINDSIFLHYRAGGSFGAFECNGKGKKMATDITQAEFAPTGAEWYYTYTSGCCPEKHFNHIVSEKDTIVEESSCRALRQYYDNSNAAGATYIIKQEQGKIYYYYQGQFNLLFDFDAKVNDTIEFTFIYKKYDDFPLPSYKDTILSARFEIESIAPNAQNLKTFRTKVLDEDAHKLYGSYLDYISHYTYTEKIGLHGEFMPVFDNAAHPDEEVFRWLRCYSDAGFSFISNEWTTISLPCDYSTATGIDIPQNDSIATGIDILQDENIKIYPNPFNDNVFVFTSNGGYVEIIDASGKAVYYSELSNGVNEISTGHFFTGIYFVKIRNKDNRIKTFKIIKS
ncbi:MAG: T9SS type A sorting domain-containing protein [Prevotellaceae bacterium]|jgi:hypothetical protein|nr:T9SS type A sorting domain-containing protein [Prevotellaceae bacterium]